MQYSKIILWTVLGGVLLIVIVSGAAYFLTRTPADVKTTALPVALAQPITPVNTESRSITTTTTTPLATAPVVDIDSWVTPAKFLDLAISSKINDWKIHVINNNFYIKYPPQYKLERVGQTASIIPAIDIPVEPGSGYPLTLLVQEFNKTNYEPHHPITSYADGTKVSPKVVTISCGKRSYEEEQFEDSGPEMEIRHLRRFIFSGDKVVQEITFSYANCGYCTNTADGKLEQDKFAQTNEKLKCEILSTFSRLHITE